MAENEVELKWYEKKQGITLDAKKKAIEKKESKHQKRKFEKGQIDHYEPKEKKEKSKTEFSKPKKCFAINDRKGLFNPNSVPEDAKKIMAEFPEILQQVNPINSKQRSLLPDQIRNLSHSLTDERGSRRLGYMNDKTQVTAYANYFLWWNLVRLTKLFSNLPQNFTALGNNSVCLDIGSGPLTVVTALFLACPHLRKVPLTWYCMDISSQSLSLGENIYYKVCAKLECEPWKIIRVKGELGTEIKEKCDLVTSANVFNELNDGSSMPPEYYAKRYSDKIISYLDSSKAKTKILFIEPGTPKAARLVSNVRDAFIRKRFYPLAPCMHIEACPMCGGKGGKWCNLSFSTEDAPQELKRLSEKAGLPKDRAVLSFVAVEKRSFVDDLEELAENQGQVKNKFFLTVASDPIKLPGDRTGYYCCSSIGLVLAVTETKLFSGEILEIQEPKGGLKIDQKSGAKIINI